MNVSAVLAFNCLSIVYCRVYEAIYMFFNNLFFSFLLPVLSAAALFPASDNANPDHPSPVQHVERDLSQSPTLSNITLSTPSSLNTTNAIDPHCFLPNPRQPHIQPSDCHTALYALVVSPSAMLLEHWDRSSILPVESASGTCSIILARVTDTADGIFQPILVAHAAALLVRSCVTARWGYQGGTARIGQRQDFVVYLSASWAAGDMGIARATV
ncbi:hypothetical protein HO133_008155 [Letharia lupina]|uniref:Uncharacterized protein n=1 Tax=Letharia lupina TaxID=560253 RepID=A0A8H6FHG0_9LECA|nr:uncharacterized protein HO133_008155 [Letharia lupina]KAF6228425.1 hypothetical protein HO133_008155 [Letharia lupina]